MITEEEVDEWYDKMRWVMEILHKNKRIDQKTGIFKEVFYKKFSEEIGFHSMKDFEEVIHILNNENYIDEYGRDENRMLCLSKIGVDEVEKGFPMLERRRLRDRPSMPVSSLNDFLIKIDEQGEEIKTKLDEIRDMERYLEDLKNDMEFVKGILSKRLPDVEDDDTKEIIVKMLSATNVYTFLVYAIRLAKDSKSQELFKEIFLQTKSPLTLPPRTQI